jgi:serine/threonine-protein kinase HipA
MNRKGYVYCNECLAGIIEETETGYQFAYNADYLANETNKEISKTLPKRNQPYSSNMLFPFFDGLIPEGWLLVVAIENWKLNPTDRMGLLLTCCKDCIGAVSIKPVND